MSSLVNIKKSIGESSYVSALYHRYRLFGEARKQGSPILVYQMGKVGSTAILTELHNLKIPRPIYHVHFLSDVTVRDAKLRLEKLQPRHNANAWCLYESEFVRKKVVNNDDCQTVDIVSLVRDPVARNISSYFYNIKKHMPEFYSRYKNGNLSTSSLLENFMSKFHEHSMPMKWFDDEIKAVFDIDIFNFSFDKDNGYSIYENKNSRLLLLRLDKLAGCAKDAFSEYLGIEDFKIGSANTSEEQAYKHIYKKFVSEVCFSDKYLDDTYNSPFSKYFFTDNEISKMRGRWRDC